MVDRFEIVDASTAHQLGALVVEPYPHDRAAYLVEHNVTPDGKSRLVGHDGCFSWVAAELNKLAAEAAEWRAKYEALLPK